MLAPDTALAASLRSALDVVSYVPLGFGAVKVDPEQVGMLVTGWGVGGGAGGLDADVARSGTAGGQVGGGGVPGPDDLGV